MKKIDTNQTVQERKMMKGVCNGKIHCTLTPSACGVKHDTYCEHYPKKQEQALDTKHDTSKIAPDSKAQTIKGIERILKPHFVGKLDVEMKTCRDWLLVLFASQRKQDMQELREKIIRLRIDRGEKDYPQYCEDDGECFGDCSKSRDYGNNSAINIILALLAEKGDK
jgi:hypothetical protein